MAQKRMEAHTACLRTVVAVVNGGGGVLGALPMAAA
jgi:hypothetical protein